MIIWVWVVGKRKSSFRVHLSLDFFHDFFHQERTCHFTGTWKRSSMYDLTRVCANKYVDTHECMCMHVHKHTNTKYTFFLKKKKETYEIINCIHPSPTKKMKRCSHQEGAGGSLQPHTSITLQAYHSTDDHPTPSSSTSTCNSVIKLGTKFIKNTNHHHDLHENPHELLKKTAQNKICLPSKWDVRQAATETAQHPAHGYGFDLSPASRNCCLIKLHGLKLAIWMTSHGVGLLWLWQLSRSKCAPKDEIKGPKTMRGLPRHMVNSISCLPGKFCLICSRNKTPVKSRILQAEQQNSKLDVSVMKLVPK